MPPKKKSRLEQQTLFGGKQEILRSLSITHVGKHILLCAQDLYSDGKVTKGEEMLLHQYSVLSLNGDMATAVITYDEKCIITGGDKFCDNPLTDDDKGQIDNYQFANLACEHELHNVHLGGVNKKINDLKEMQHKRDKEEKVSAADNVSDIERKLSDGVDPYLIMVRELRPTGPITVHVIQKGDNKGKSTNKQAREHAYLGHKLFGIMPLTRMILQKINPGKLPGQL
jgi:hypothetical protein